eukprot:5599965-Prymnesium_polylepis.1
MSVDVVEYLIGAAPARQRGCSATWAVRRMVAPLKKGRPEANDRGRTDHRRQTMVPQLRVHFLHAKLGLAPRGAQHNVGTAGLDQPLEASYASRVKHSSTGKVVQDSIDVEKDHFASGRDGHCFAAIHRVNEFTVTRVDALDETPSKIKLQRT